MPWYQGNLHCHSTNSDGDASPADVARYYRAIGMDCVAISDHNRLTGLDEYGPVLDSDFPGVPSCEFTGPKSCHVLAVDVDEAVAPAGDRSDPSPAKILQEGIDRTRAAGGVPVLCHPCWNWAYDEEVVLGLTNVTHFEVYNASPDCNSYPGFGRSGLEQIWDRVLSAGLRIFGVATGINDDLNGVERPVRFEIGHMDNEEVQVVQSLAKWKRLALADLGFRPGDGIYTDMNAIRPDDFLKSTVRTIYDVIRRTERFIGHEYDSIDAYLPTEIEFVHAEDLLRRYPELTPKEREYQACREFGAVFVIGIGGELSDGSIHDGRAPDYDDWSTPTGDGYSGLNGDILVYNRVLDAPFELSSMGIRVDRAALERQLAIRGAEDRRELYFHGRLLAGELPLSIGGGIGQSRLSMLLLQKAHIGEIQASVWPDEMIDLRAANKIFLL